MSKKKKKYYVVWKGRKTGIFESWAECNAQISGFKGAEYKSFPTIKLAEKAFQRNSKDYIGNDTFFSELSEEALKIIGDPITESISVDAAWDTSTGLMEYQGVHTKTEEVIFHQGPFEDGTNNVGEFLAIVHAAAHLKKNRSNLPIYTDSLTALAWVRKKHANTKLKKTEKNRKLFELIKRAEKWLLENEIKNPLLKWETKAWGEIAADFGRK